MSKAVRAAQGMVVASALAVLWFTYSPPRAKISPPLVSASSRQLMTDIQLKDLNGENWRLKDHLGKVVIVNFWETWCPPCRAETPGLIRLARSYETRGLRIVGIAMDEGETAPVVKFASTFGIPYPILLPVKEFDLANRVESLLTSFLIDQRGRVAKTYIGGVPEEEFRQDVDRLLAE